MDSWLNMMLLCGLLLIASLQTTNAFRFRRSKSEMTHLETNIHSLQEHYKTRGTEWVSKSVFVPHLNQLNSKASCTCQALLLERMLNIYEELFQDMKSEHKEGRKDLDHLMDEVKKLRGNYKEEHKVWKELQEMNSVKVKNGTIRGGALNDFLMVFDRASTEKHKKVQ
uniref:Interferon gamma n=1 Tax=Ctenopharyngodon idella TaxID=7959 RepID=C0LEE1_CTEID|nr:interferon gamma [Ctenopharyngodon idella]ACN56579.1 interferon gamma [Ctenopharyngodon idella]7X45_A Chain A, Interferon gamma [Ctenopharyngodon idella]7X45_B Chain B, Interferon gamma [Ctenopharyngodon idella]